MVAINLKCQSGDDVGSRFTARTGADVSHFTGRLRAPTWDEPERYTALLHHINQGTTRNYIQLFYISVLTRNLPDWRIYAF